MALLMVVRVWLPPTFAGVDPEAQVSARMLLSHEPVGHQTTGKRWMGQPGPREEKRENAVFRTLD